MSGVFRSLKKCRHMLLNKNYMRNWGHLRVSFVLPMVNQFRYNHLILFLLVYFPDSWLEDGGLCFNCIIGSTLNDNYQDLAIRRQII